MFRKSNQVSLEPYGYTVAPATKTIQAKTASGKTLTLQGIREVTQRVPAQAVADTPKPRKRSHLQSWLALAIVIVAVGWLYWAFPSTTRTTGSSPVNNDPMYVARRNAIVPVPDVRHASTYHNVVYKITTSRDWGGCYGFDTTYEMPSGTAQKSVTACDKNPIAVVDQRIAQDGDFVYLSVQNDEQSADIACQIFIDNRLVYETHSSGQFVNASCSGSVN